MPSAKRSVTIRRPVEEVFAYIADGLNGPKWRSGVLDIALVKGKGVGAVYRQGVKGPLGRRIAADYEITDLETNRRIAFKAIAGPVRPDGEFTFKAAGEGTTVTFAVDAQLSGLRRFLLGRSVQGTMNAEMAALDKLKSNLEGGTRKAAPAPTAKAGAAAKAAPATKAAPAANATAAAPKTTAARRTPAAKSAAAQPKPTSRRSPKK